MKSSIRWIPVLTLAFTLLLPWAQAARADGGVTFTDIAAGDGAGITYRRARSPRDAIFDALKAQATYTFLDLVHTPMKPRGAPGVALFDYDGDGDLDVYVTNGPGAANSLYSNQLVESGSVHFVDVAVAAGVAATDQDSTGVCAGDVDNDGDDDLLVLGLSEPNRLFENRGGGTFWDVTTTSGMGGGNRGSSSCSLGDTNGDGLLDIVVANSYNLNHQVPILVEPYALNEHNQLFQNTGGNVFVDTSAASGLEATRGFTPPADGSPTITWAIALVDVDLDGDLDVVHTDDQAAIPPFAQGGVDRGILHIFQNDGTGTFTDVSVAAGTDKQGSWMGLAFGDLNCDGRMDVFGTNLGDYMMQLFDPTYQRGGLASRWFLGEHGGTFSDPGVGGLKATPFGWGVGLADYDNDGDTDIVYHGGLDAGVFVEASNPGAVLQNQGCSASFVYDAAATSATDHQRRNVQGVALGDLDDDGFVDVVSVSNFDQPAPFPLIPYPVAWGSDFDLAAMVPTFTPTGPGEWVWNGINLPDGTLSVELSSGNGNAWVKVTPLGTKGVTTGGVANRGGVGAVLSFTPDGGATSMRPIVAGSSHASSHSREAVFGLGSASRGTLEVLWPGGVRNRLRDVGASERLTVPEIPCDYGAQFEDRGSYVACVQQAVDELVAAGVLDSGDRGRYLSSALACESAPGSPCPDS